MNARNWRISDLDQVLHRRLFTLIVLSYALAAIAPAAGLLIRDALLDLDIARSGIVTLPQLLLSFLLFCAALRVRGERVRQILDHPSPILIRLLANLAIPLLYLVVLTPVLRGWHNASEAATILIGLALVAAMPVAGSSTGWAQNSGGDVTLSLGLVIASTLLSPLTTPVALRNGRFVAPSPCEQCTADAERASRERRGDKRIILFGGREPVGPRPISALAADELLRQGLGPGDTPPLGVDLLDSQRAEGMSDRPCIIEIGRVAIDFTRALERAGMDRGRETLLQPCASGHYPRVIVGKTTSQQCPQSVGRRTAIGVVAQPAVSIRARDPSLVSHRV
jgi:Sodium Bile acid symporter family